MEDNMNTANGNAPSVGLYRPQLAFYHATAKGTGCAMKLTLHPAHDDTDGCIMLKMANQLTVGDRRGPNPTYPKFDWESALTVKLDFSDLSQMLQVFRGECESLNEGRGLFHATSAFTTRIVLRHGVDPVSCYSIELYRSSRGGQEESHTHIVLSSAEALGLSLAVESSFGVISFGIPMLREHDTSAYRRREREARNGVAA